MWTQNRFNERQENTERILNSLQLDFSTRKQSRIISISSHNELNFSFIYCRVIITLVRSILYIPPQTCLSQDWTKFSSFGQSYHNALDPGWLTVSRVIIRKNAQVFRYCLGHTSRSFQVVKMVLVFLHFIHVTLWFQNFLFHKNTTQSKTSKTKPSQLLSSSPFRWSLWCELQLIISRDTTFINTNQIEKLVQSHSWEFSAWIKYLAIFPGYHEFVLACLKQQQASQIMHLFVNHTNMKIQFM